MKKVVAIIGSLRKESINRVLFEEYKKIAQGKMEIIEGSIGELPHYNQDLDQKMKEVWDLGSLIQSADGVLFFSPEYNYSVPGVLKNALDWISRDERKPFENKPAAIIGASPGAIGTARMQYHLRQIGVFLNLQFLNKPEVMVGSAADKIKDGKLVDTSTKEFLAKHLEAFSKHIELHQ